MINSTLPNSDGESHVMNDLTATQSHCMDMHGH